MRKFTAIVLLLIALLIPAVNAAAQVITADPNTGGTQAPKVEQADERLLKPVTYEGGYKRLHDVADEITKLTGVTVRCGHNNDDWHTRDIPLVVCVKDMPLGRLLKMVASAAHTQLASETVGKEDPVRVYRFIRTRDGEKELTDPIAAKMEANRRLISWAWDVMAAYGKMPDAPLEIRPEYYSESPNVRDLDGNKLEPSRQSREAGYLGLEPGSIKAAARVIAALDPSVKERVFAGEQVTVKMSDAAGESLRALYQYICKNPSGLRMAANGFSVLEPSFSEIQDASLQIKLGTMTDPSPSAGLRFIIQGFPFEVTKGERMLEPWQGTPVAQARMLAYAKGLDLPPMPDSNRNSQDEVESPGPEFEPIVAEKDYDHPALQFEVKPELPEDKAFITYAEAITVMAKASGFNVVCEDFVSQMIRKLDVKELGKENTLSPLLERVSKMQGTRWFLSKDERVLVGHARNCRDDYTNLVPERLLTTIHGKLAGSGAELDDLTPLMQLAPRQIMEWISEGPDLLGSKVIRLDGSLAIWRLYDALKPEYKAMAKSASGFPLAALDPVWVSNFIKEHTEEARNGVVSLSTEGESKTPSPLANPDFVKQLVMRVENKPLERWDIVCPNADGSTTRTTCQSQPEGLQKHTYRIILSGTYNGTPVEIAATCDQLYFPRFTPEKELELYKKAAEKK